MGSTNEVGDTVRTGNRMNLAWGCFDNLIPLRWHKTIDGDQAGGHT